MITFSTHLKNFFGSRNHRISAIILIIVIVMMILPTSIYKNPDLYKHNLEKLDEKKATVTAVSAITAAAATALAAIPQDATTPVADQIAELAGYSFLISLIILIQKYVIVLAGLLSFKWLLPIAGIFYIVYLLREKEGCRRMALRLIALCLCLLLIVPVSLVIDDFIDLTFDTSKPIREIMNEEISEEELASEESEGGKTIFEKAGTFFSNLFSGAKQLAEDAVNLLNKLIDVFVALVLKDCVMPILTFFLLYKICKSIVMSILPNDVINRKKKELPAAKKRSAA